MSTSIRCVDQRMYFLTTVMVEKMYEDNNERSTAVEKKIPTAICCRGMNIEYQLGLAEIYMSADRILPVT